MGETNVDRVLIEHHIAAAEAAEDKLRNLSADAQTYLAVCLGDVIGPVAYNRAYFGRLCLEAANPTRKGWATCPIAIGSAIGRLAARMKGARTLLDGARHAHAAARQSELFGCITPEEQVFVVSFVDTVLTELEARANG